MAGTLGTITGQVRIDTKQAIAAYAALRAANITTILALRSASTAFIAAGSAALAGGLLIGAGFAKAIKSAAEFEKQLDFFGAVSNSTEADMEAVRAKALQLGKDTRFSAGEIADSFVELGKAGVSAKQIIGGVGQAVASLGAAADIPLAQAANIITSAVQTFKLQATDAVHVADLLAGAANASIAEVDDLGVSLKYVGGVAASISIPIEDTITAISLLATAGIRGSTAGTSLRQILVSLTGTSKKAHAQLEDLGIITKTGANLFFDAAGKAKPLAEIFQILQDHTKGLTEAQRLSAFKIIFNNRALAAANILAREGASGFAKMNTEIGKTTAADVAAKRMDNLSGDVEILRGNIETLLIEAGTPFQNFLRGIVQGLTGMVKAFSSLSPSMQKAIFLTLAISAALLIVMGTVSIMIGIVLRFASNILMLGKAIGTAVKFVKIMAGAMRVLTLSLLTNPIFLIITALVLLGIALFIAYKKSETFRNIVNAVGKAIVVAFKAVVSFFQGLPAFFSSVWGKITGAFEAAKNGVVTGWNAVGTFFKNLWNSIVNGVKSFIDRTVAFFAALPGRILNFVVALVTGIIQYFAQLPERVAYFIGFMVGRAILLFAQLQLRLAQLAAAIVNGIISFFVQLPGRAAAFFMALANRSASILQSLWSRATALAAAIYNGIVNFLARLPGRVASFFASLYSSAVAKLSAFASAAGRFAQSAARAVVSALQSLPNRVGTFFRNMATAAANALRGLVTSAGNIARQIPGAITGALSGLGGLLKQIILNAINSMASAGGAAYEKAKNIGSSLWKGFKDGMGIHSPSFIEKAMFQVHDTMVDEIGFLGRMVSKAQNLGGRVPKIQRTIAATQAAQNARVDQVVSNGSPVSRNAGLSTQTAKIKETDPTKKKFQMVEGKLSLDESGRAFIRGVATEVIDDSNEYDDSLGRMG